MNPTEAQMDKDLHQNLKGKDMSHAKVVEAVDSTVRPLLSPVVKTMVEKLIKVSTTLDTNGQPTLQEVAEALQLAAVNLRASQKEHWRNDDQRWNELNIKLIDPKIVHFNSRPLLIGLGNRLIGLYGLYESMDSARASALVPIIEEVSQAIVDLASTKQTDDKFSAVFEKAGITEQQAADRLT